MTTARRRNAVRQPAARDRSIGIFDSGIGGLTVVRALAKLLPNESLIYLGDTGRYPYGTKSADVVRRYSFENTDFLVDKGSQAARRGVQHVDRGGRSRRCSVASTCRWSA